MKRTITPTILVIVFASLFVWSLISNVQAPNVQASEEPRGCGQRTLRGEYLLTGRADRAPNDPATNFPRVFAGVWTFDGAGNLSQFATESFGGQINRRVTLLATYTLDSDCTGTLHFETGANWDLFTNRNGSEGNAVRYDEGFIATRSFKRR